MAFFLLRRIRSPLAQCGLSEMSACVSAFGAKRTSTVVWLRPPRPRMTQSERTALAETLLAARTSDALSQRGG